MALATIPIDLIETGQRLRATSAAQVESLASSIAAVGLLNPITVFERSLFRGGDYVTGYGIVAGAHRFEACKQLGLVEIDANIVSLTDLERQIAECDENLCGSVLSKSERALFTKRRKDAYEALHPETRNGATGIGRDKVRQVGEANDRFTSDTATKTGQSERAVQRDAERGAKISERALTLVKGSKLDNGSYLDKLKAIPAEEQVSRVRSDLSNQSGVARRFKIADAPLDDAQAQEKWLAAGMAWWNRGSQEWRQEFLSRIDTPVFDRSAA